MLKPLTVENDLVFDPFMGSGTAGIATLDFGRKFIGYENNEEYFKTAELNLKSPKFGKYQLEAE